MTPRAGATQVKTLVTLLANELSDDEVEAPAALAESEATPSTMADDEWSTYLFSSYLPADPMGDTPHLF